MDVSLSKIWKSWYAFRRGKKRNKELDTFFYSLETNLSKLRRDLVSSDYQHGPYKRFSITDSKRRIISVASIRDRVVHRLVYDYLTDIFDKTFLYDSWSCRKGKGLSGAIKRTQKVIAKYRYSYIWRGDITKFFDSVDHEILKTNIRRKVRDKKALKIIDNIIDSYHTFSRGLGMPIGNLTSQIFTNIYLHELDWHIFHRVKPISYIRYGDDFIILMKTVKDLKASRDEVITFLADKLKLTIHSTNNIIISASRGIHFLGCDIYPTGRRLRKRMISKIKQKLKLKNSSSYRALALAHFEQNVVKWIDWKNLDTLDQL